MDGGRASVRNVRSKCRCSHVLQFTFRRAVCCVLHRPPSQVIHCTVLSLTLAQTSAWTSISRCRRSDGNSSLRRHGECLGGSGLVFLGRRRLNRPDGAPAAGEQRGRDRGRLCGPRTKDPEVRATSDDPPVLPRPVPAAARVRVEATPFRETAGVWRLATDATGNDASARFGAVP